MVSDVEVGLQLFDYMEQVNSIMTVLSEGSLSAQQAAVLVAGEAGVYEGRAADELAQFCVSYSANIDKLCMLYSVTVGYLGKIFEVFVNTDEELTQFAELILERVS